MAEFKFYSEDIEKACVYWLQNSLGYSSRETVQMEATANTEPGGSIHMPICIINIIEVPNDKQ